MYLGSEVVMKGLGNTYSESRVLRKVWGSSLLLCGLLFFVSPTPVKGKVYKKVDAQGNITFYNRPVTKTKAPPKIGQTPYDDLIRRHAKKAGLDPYLIKCIIKVESDFRADAVSVAGAMGLMQLMQGTARIYGVTDPLNPEENVRAGVRHFKGLMKYLNNDIPLALAAYHAGLGRVKKRMAVPPIKSTIAYVNKIMFLYRGTRGYGPRVKTLYKKIDKDGDILFYNRK